MKTNCKGCQEDFAYACGLQEEEELYLVQAEITHIGEKDKHFFLMMVDDEGKIVIS